MEGNFNVHSVLQGHWIVYTHHARGIHLSHVILFDSVFVPALVQSSLSQGTHIPVEHLVTALKLTIVHQVQRTIEGQVRQVSTESCSNAHQRAFTVRSTLPISQLFIERLQLGIQGIYWILLKFQSQSSVF